jgi:prevent-host-death family protein
MIVISATEASRNLPDLIARAARGEDVVLTEKGNAVARIVSAKRGAMPANDAIRQLLALRAGTRLDGLDWRDLRDTGRA